MLIKTGRLEQNKHNTSKKKETGGESNINTSISVQRKEQLQ